ncbi:phenylacetate--CoA ligase, partial [bacterium]|nr:phenylacetate--CoA ligase [bacterium]
MYWEEKIETMGRKEIEKLQIELFNETIERARKSPFYSKVFKKKKLPEKITSIEEIKEFPFTTKEDLRKSYPFGMLATDIEKIVRMHGSSGTTGKSTLVFHTKNDIERWADLIARCLYMIGVRDCDVFQNMMSYGLFTGGLGLHYGAEKIGALVIPIGSGNTQKQIEFLIDLKTTTIHITPSYLFYLAHVAESMGLSPSKDFYLKRAIVGAEPYSESTRKKLEDIFKIKIFNCYGLSEMNGPGVAFECPEQKGLHLWEDHYFAEIIDPETGKTLPDGEEGELVLTTLKREGMPLIRYRTRDITKIIKGKCKCGRTHRKIARIKGRTDDMFIVKGVNIFPSQIEGVLM